MSIRKTLSLQELTVSLGGFFIIFLFLWLLFFISSPLSVFLFLFGILFIVFIFIKPIYGLFSLILLRPTLDIFTSKAALSLGNYSVNVASLLGIMAIILSLYIITRNFKKLKNLPNKFPIFLFIFIALISALSLLGENQKDGFPVAIFEMVRLISIFSLYALSFLLIDNLKDFKRLIYIIILSTIIPGLLAFYQFFAGTGMTIIDEDITNRIFGTFAHPNLFAYYLTIPLALLVFLFLNKKNLAASNYFVVLSFLPIFILLLLTYTRGAWVVFLIITFILGFFRYKKFLIGSLLALILIYFIFPPLNTRVNNLFEYNPYSSIQWRINLWKDGIKYSQEKIVAGHGLGVASKLILERRGERFGSSDPHNDYLKILIENGILGIIAYLILIIGLFLNLLLCYFKGNSNLNKNIFLLFMGITLALYFMSFADNILRNTALQWIFWILLGALFANYQNNSLSAKK